jgi:hypothetical protein
MAVCYLDNYLIWKIQIRRELGLARVLEAMPLFKLEANSNHSGQARHHSHYVWSTPSSIMD